MSCEKCGQGVHLPLEEMSGGGMDLSGAAPVCDGCDMPEGLCSCKPIEASEPDCDPAGSV